MPHTQVQSAELNLSNKHLRSTQSNISESNMCEARQQQYYQSANNYDDNDIEQRESLLHSLEQNPHMLNDF